MDEAKIGSSASGVDASSIPNPPVRKVSDFDWKVAEKLRSKRVFDYLVENFDKPIDEETYVQQVTLLRKLNYQNRLFSGNKKNYRGKATPTGSRREYRDLKEKFGFFC